MLTAVSVAALLKIQFDRMLEHRATEKNAQKPNS